MYDILMSQLHTYSTGVHLMLIKTVAIYNRISRDNGESDDVLLNHRTITTRLCESKGYQYKLYEEIESGGKFEERTELLRMLRHI